MSIKHNMENIEKLSKEVVDSWEMDTLLNYAIERLSDFYRENPDDFKDEWENMFE